MLIFLFNNLIIEGGIYSIGLLSHLKYFKFYNFERHHQALNYKKPAEVYFGKKLPVDYINNVDNSLLVPRKVIHIINVGPQVQQQ